MNISINSIYFLVFSLLLILSAILTIASKKMVTALLWSIVVFMSVGGLFLLLGATYNAIAQLLVYVVAVPVLIAVSIMLIKQEKSNYGFSLGKIISVLGIIALILLAIEFVSLNSNIFQIIKSCYVYVNPYSDLISISKNLLGVYPIFLLEFGLGIILTVMGICYYEK